MLGIYMLLILNQKTAPVLKISYNLLNLSLKLLQICSYVFTDLQDQILEKIFLQEKNAKYFYILVFTCFLILSCRSCYID